MADDAGAAEPKVFPPNSVHAVRTAQQIHVTLSQMADQKANMLLAATFNWRVVRVATRERPGNPARGGCAQ